MILCDKKDKPSLILNLQQNEVLTGNVEKELLIKCYTCALKLIAIEQKIQNEGHSDIPSYGWLPYSHNGQGEARPEGRAQELLPYPPQWDRGWGPDSDSVMAHPWLL